MKRSKTFTYEARNSEIAVSRYCNASTVVKGCLHTFASNSSRCNTSSGSDCYMLRYHNSKDDDLKRLKLRVLAPETVQAVNKVNEKKQDPNIKYLGSY